MKLYLVTVNSDDGVTSTICRTKAIALQVFHESTNDVLADYDSEDLHDAYADFQEDGEIDEDLIISIEVFEVPWASENGKDRLTETATGEAVDFTGKAK